VLSKRLGLVVSEARRMGPKSLSYHVGGKTIEFPVEKLERFLHAMMGGLFEHKQYGRKIIIGLAGWNIRKAFEIFLEFCRSGFIREEDIFVRQLTSGQPAGLPHGVVAKVLLRTNRRYYNGDESFVKNLFQSDPASPKPSSFLRYWILSWLRSKGGVIGPSGVKGYHPQGDLIRDMLTIGADPEATRVECRYLAKAGCLLPEHLRPDCIKDSDLLCITPAGHVHLELAHRDIAHLAACSEDAWVTSFNLAEAIRHRITQQPYWKGLAWHNALANAAEFCAYLKTAQENSIHIVPYLPLSPAHTDRLNFHKLLEEIASHQQRAAAHHNKAPDLHPSHDHPAEEAD
jgi:hypothetical protein